jgi:hypothetical protein
MSELAQIALQDCGCCSGIEVETPLGLYNRPGLSAIAYRVGAYGSFRKSLLARLSDARWSALRQLRTRDNDDFTIALLDAWAVASDVLTFYQERIANESYLRTATERLSILELARLLGYQLAPGLAASTYLAFTMETAPGAPEQATKSVHLAIGSRVQSVPGPDEQPQSFETSEAIEARPEWNAILPQLSEPQTLTWDMTQVWLEGVNLTLAVGDVLLIIAGAGSTKQASLRRVAKVSPDAGANRTGVTLTTISSTAQTVPADRSGVFVMRTIASPFGHNAPKEAKYVEGRVQYPFTEWKLKKDESNKEIMLSARYDKILVGSWAVVEREDSSATDKRHWTFARVDRVIHASVAKYGLAGNATQLSFKEDVWLTEHANLSVLRKITVTAQSEELVVADVPLTAPVYGAMLPLNSRIEGLAPGRPIAISGKRQRVRIKEQVNFDDNSRAPLTTGDILTLAKRPVEVVSGQEVALTPEEFAAAVNDKKSLRLRLSLMDRDGRIDSVEFCALAIELEPAAASDALFREIVFIDDLPDSAIIIDRDRTTLQLASPLIHVYDRATVRINANVAAATHGESVQELLGSGDATLTYQRFTLRQPPLTYVSADTPSGSASTLNVYVNDVLWREAPFFYGRGANERIYILRHDDDGRTTVQFGDGINGARLPTGQNNVRAEYRKGSGLGGLVQAGQLSQLLSRPLGLRDVVNPAAAEGAQAPESREDARQNAPTTVLTLDRVVSLQDYEDFSRTFAGVAKAQAVWVWDGRKRTVFLTVAGPEGKDIDESGAVATRLKEALRTYGDPFVGFTIKNFRKVPFQVHGTVTVASDHVIDTVMNAVHGALLKRYSFDVRAFGQPVALSEVIALIQSVPGVVAVDIDEFYRNDKPPAGRKAQLDADHPAMDADGIRNDKSPPGWKARLDADRPAMGADGIVQAAELLLLDASSLNHLGATQ